jgi:hypothetical protein
MAGERSIASVVWMWGSQDPAKVFEEIYVENHYIADSGLVERYVLLAEYCLVHVSYMLYRHLIRSIC